MGILAHSVCVARACATISGKSDDGVFSNWPTTAPVAGSIDGSASIGMAVAAISEILTDFAPRMCARTTCDLFWRLHAARKSDATLLLTGFGNEELQILGLPAHRGADAIAPTRVV